MSWIRIDDHAPEHPKLLKAGPTAGWLWVCGLAYCSRHLTDGTIPAEAVPTMGVPKAQDSVARLLRVGLWEETPTGYHVHDYHQYQPSRTQVETRRQRTAERVAKWKETHGYACDSTVTNGVGNAVTTPPPDPPPPPPPDPVPLKPVYTAPLAARSEHKAHAFCGRACLPAFLYREFVQLRGGAEDDARREVDDWALALVRAISDVGPRATEPIGDPLKWWRARWEEAHPTRKAEPADPHATTSTKAEQDAAFETEVARRAKLKRMFA